jgi:hypothetical protein
MYFRDVQRKTLTFTLPTAEFSYYTCNILEGSSVSAPAEQMELGLDSSDGDWYFPTEPQHYVSPFTRRLN